MTWGLSDSLEQGVVCDAMRRLLGANNDGMLLGAKAKAPIYGASLNMR